MEIRDDGLADAPVGMRVLVYSPVVLFGEGIAAFLASIESILAVRVQHDAIALDDDIADFRPDVVVLDVTAPETLAIAQAVKELWPDIVLVALAVTDMAEEVLACVDAGFSAYVPRTATAEQLVSILTVSVRGETVCDPRIARSLFDELARRRPRDTVLPDREEYLTPREVEIAKLMGRGAANKEIAEELHLSIATIKNHVHSVLRKLNTERRAEVGRAMLERPGLLHVPDHDARRRAGRQP
jgi:DNA-binding NarL/FixJ family response regulator